MTGKTELSMTPAQAAQIMEADKQHRVQMAAEAVQCALSDYNCDIVAVPTISPDGRIAASVQLIAK
mgnify:CR=1 FL=1